MKAVILLAVYNGSAFLRAQLDSLHIQSEPDFSVLIQDDGSTDDSLSILRSFCLDDDRFVLSQNGGRHLGAAANFFDLLDQAPPADIYLFCDQDDIWRPDKLHCITSAMKDAIGHYGCGMPLLIHSDAALIDGASNDTCDSFFRHQQWDPDAVSLQQLLVQNNVTGCTMAINEPLRSVISRAASLPDSFHDWFIAQTAAAFGRIVFIDSPLIFYRQHDSNTIGASRKGLLRRSFSAVTGSGRDRIRLTYTMAEHFLEAYNNELSQDARQTVCTYLAARSKCKPARVFTVFKGGYRMQSRLYRLGQILFG